ncbi:unnamed protein product [Rotaria socialis]
MRQLIKEYRMQTMSLYLQLITREREIITDEMKNIIQGILPENDERFNGEENPAGSLAFKHYNDLRKKRLNLEAEQSLYFLEEQRVEGEVNEQDEIVATTLTRSLETIDFNQYQLTKCPITTDKQRKQKNYGRLIKRLKHKLRSTNIVIQKTDKSKVFHLDKLQDYHKKSEEYMEKTEAYECLHQNDPLPNLIESTNKYLLKLRLDNWITQNQYEQLSTPLRPIVSGLKHPTIKISRFLDELLRSLFDRMASSTTVTPGTEVIKQLYEWSKSNARQDTLICTMDVIDLYTMIPQTEGILAIKKMLDYLNIKQINGLKIETVIRLSA